MASAPLKYRRILLKVSGESLAGEKKFGLDPATLRAIAREIKDIADLKVEIGIPSGRQTDGLRENCLRVVGHPVKGFGPPVVRRNAKARYGGRGHLHQGSLLFEVQAGDEVIHAFLHWQRGIVERGQWIRTRRAREGCIASAGAGRINAAGQRSSTSGFRRSTGIRDRHTIEAAGGCSRIGGGVRRRIR